MAGGRERFERRVSPVIGGVLEADEVVTAAGYAMTAPSRTAIAVAGGLAALTAHHYWVAVTNRRLVVLRMTKVGTTPVLAHVTGCADVRVRRARRTLIDLRLDLEIGTTSYALRFPIQYRRDGEAIATALGGLTARV
jgi:hypothetical protein